MSSRYTAPTRRAAPRLEQLDAALNIIDAALDLLGLSDAVAAELEFREVAEA